MANRIIVVGEMEDEHKRAINELKNLWNDKQLTDKIRKMTVEELMKKLGDAK